MSTKVLVFESDPSFAGELRNEFDKLGCTTTVVEDGNLGLQQAASERPDLILLSIELPRMNGFSVCNKLKKDPSLKDVPLIIMSSESTDETFEQHKKLRTRAEDYVHKPIGFGELLAHVRTFVPLAASAPEEDEDAIVIDDEIEIGTTDYVVDEPSNDAAERDVGSTMARRIETVDADVDAFAESAFGRLTTAESVRAEAHRTSNGHAAAAEAPPSAPRSSIAPPARHSLAPGIDPREHERLNAELVRASAELTHARDDLARTSGELARTSAELARANGEISRAATRAEELGRALEESNGELERLRSDAVESERLGREIEELKGKIASAPKGNVSSREFLDLRETLNKKDKELLGLREVLSKKDKQIVEAQDRALAIERAGHDADERLLTLERAHEETKEKNESLVADRDLAKKASEDFRARLEKLRAEGEAKDRALLELRTRQAEEMVAAEERSAALRAELDQILANERAEHARALDQVEARRRAELDQARRDRETQLAAAKSEADEALARTHAELGQREQASLAAQRGQLEAAAAHALGEARQQAEGELQEANERAAGEIAAMRESAAALGTDLAGARAELAALGQAKGEVDRRLALAEARVATLEGELDETRSQLGSTEQRLTVESARAEHSQEKWQADRMSLERAKDALAAALAQIEEIEERV